eukprot:m.137184 g.137184  ORF g.137184 m.137184 type:complete len:298 (-) comp11385_c0_seq1:40-933(-)
MLFNGSASIVRRIGSSALFGFARRELNYSGREMIKRVAAQRNNCCWTASKSNLLYVKGVMNEATLCQSRFRPKASFAALPQRSFLTFAKRPSQTTPLLKPQFAGMSTWGVLKSKSSPVFYTIIGATAIGFIGVITWRVSKFMSSLTFVNVTYFGFYLGGIASAFLVVLGALLWRKYRGLHPESLHREVMRRISNTAIINKKLGKEVVTGDFRAYSPSGGLIMDVSKTLPRIRYDPVSLDMMFQLHGENDSAMCSVRAQNIGGTHKISSLALDFSDGKRFILAGKPDDVVFKGLTKLR